jgi:hypothetical protein
MTTQTVPRPAAVAAVLARASTWTHGRRKADGREFYIVPGSQAGTVYYADPTCCTCPDARNRGRLCKHSLAVAEFVKRHAPKSPAETLEMLKAEQREHARRLRLIGYCPGEEIEHPVYAQRAEHIARLERDLAATA